MSLKSWKKEFYPKSAKSLRGGDLVRVRHSLQKWRGLTKDNLKRHDVECVGGDVTEYDKEPDPHYGRFIKADLPIDSESCALCVKYFDKEAASGERCYKCPLVEVRGKPCDRPFLNSPFTVWQERSNPQPMIELLEKAETMLMEGKK